MVIEALNLQNFDAALELLQNYQEFYQVQSIDPEKNRQHLSRIMNNEELGKLFLLQDREIYLGFATIYYSFSSTTAEQIAILNDLYVLENYRRQGYGKKLVDYCINYLQSLGMSRVRWSTTKDNAIAQQLYKKYGNGSEWLIYSYQIN
ncbi:MAG: GNAT family N-acetyltransferase [Calothrix sp. MO_167.B12]|nr:GNAT family N-acetyltransferase [Calothrix sp. MO_167.B12]